jgi:hypothetical protein
MSLYDRQHWDLKVYFLKGMDKVEVIGKHKSNRYTHRGIII